MIRGASSFSAVSEMQMFLEWKVPAVRHVKQQAGKEVLAGTKGETVLIARKYN